MCMILLLLLGLQAAMAASSCVPAGGNYNDDKNDYTCPGHLSTRRRACMCECWSTPYHTNGDGGHRRRCTEGPGNQFGVGGGHGALCAEGTWNDGATDECHSCPNGDIRRRRADTCTGPWQCPKSCPSGYTKRQTQCPSKPCGKAECCQAEACASSKTASGSGDGGDSYILKGVNVLTGVPGNSPIWHDSQDAYEYRDEPEEENHFQATVSTSFAQAMTSYQLELGFSVSSAAMAEAGIQKGSVDTFFQHSKFSKYAWSAFSQKVNAISRASRKYSFKKGSRRHNEQKLSPAFLDDVKGLPQNPSNSEWRFFYQRFGTHFAEEVEVGGFFQHFASYEECSAQVGYARMIKTCHQLDLGLAFEDAGVGGAGSSSSSQCKTRINAGSTSQSGAAQLSNTYVQGGDTSQLFCGPPATRWKRYRKSISKLNAFTKPSRLHPVWSLLRQANRSGLQSAAEKAFYVYVDAEGKESPKPTVCKIGETDGSTRGSLASMLAGLALLANW